MIDERNERGELLFEDRGHQVKYLGKGQYRVPSGTREGEFHYVDARRQFCSCWDWSEINKDRDPDKEPMELCKHCVCVKIFRLRTAVCDGCRTRKNRGEFWEVFDSLTYFEFDLLCESCWKESDAEVY